MQRRLEQFRALPRGEAQSLPGALPPGQSWVPKGFPVLDLGEHPEISHDDWRLSVDGQVQVPIELDLAGLLELSSVSLEVDIHCVTAWSVPSAQWLGVPTEALKPLLDLEEDVTHVMVYGSDGYAANLCLKDFFAENSLLAYGLNGGELSISHGGPVRLVVPHLYFWKSPKWINRLEFMKSDRPGFWEQRGYHNRGNPWSEERSAPITQPKVVENPATESAQNTRITEGHAKRLSWWGRIKDWF
jgi:DMSO/TMAO reductase YedYZ molybdopterin-dependent catalytic subunit